MISLFTKPLHHVPSLPLLYLPLQRPQLNVLFLLQIDHSQIIPLWPQKAIGRFLDAAFRINFSEKKEVLASTTLPFPLRAAVNVPLTGTQPPDKRGGIQTWVSATIRAVLLATMSYCLLLITSLVHRRKPKCQAVRDREKCPGRGTCREI